MRYLFIMICLLFAFSCGERKEKEKETVYNDPRFNDVPCDCHCNGSNCNQCPKQCTIKISNNNTNECNKDCDVGKEPKKDQPIIIIQEQKQDQTSDNQNANDNANDNSKKTYRAIIENRYYKCWKPCYSCVPPVDIEPIMNNLKREIHDEFGDLLDCYRN